MNYDNLISSGRIIYHYIRGSKLFGLDTENSDIDTGGVFIGPKSWFLGLGDDYIDTIHSENHDDFFMELKKYMTQLEKSSPEVLESLFVPDNLILYKDPIMNLILKNRDKFITKECIKPFYFYSKSQIKKAKGLKKMISMDINKVSTRKTPLEFCYVSIGSGKTMRLDLWLKKNGLKECYCGLVKLPNYFEGYALFYDWGADVELDDSKYSLLTKLQVHKPQNIIGYRGILSPSDPNTTMLRLSSIPKEEIELCTFQFGMNAFSQHCNEFKNYNEWVKKRNNERYQLNKEYNFDSKNMTHTVRLLTQSLEIVQGKGLILNRKGIDREFLLNIKNHKISYDEIIKYSENLIKQLENEIPKSNLPEKIDKNFIEELILEMRDKFYKKLRI